MLEPPAPNGPSRPRKPWSLRGREMEIVEMRDVQKLSFEQIAVLLIASKQGVQDAYKRAKAKAENDAQGVAA